MLIRAAVLMILLASLPAGRVRAAGPAKSPRPTLDQIGVELQTLVDWEELDDPKATLRDVLNHLRNTYKVNVPFDYNDKAFGEAFGDSTKDVRDAIVGKIEADRLPLGRLLHRILGKLVVGGGGATFMLRAGHIEITTEAAIARELKLAPADDDAPSRLPTMITYLKLDGETLEAACEKIADRAGVTVAIDPRAKEKASAVIKARLVNIPLDTAMELVADMAGLAVTRKANAYYLTTPENAAKMKGGK